VSGKSGLHRVSPVAGLVAVIAAVYLTGLYRHLSLEGLQRNEALLRREVEAAPVLAALAYIAAYAAITGAGVPIALMLTMTSGLLFGPWIGGAVTVVGATAGAVLTFLAVRSAVGGWLRRLAERRGGKLARLLAGFDRGPFVYLLSIRLLPLAPYFMVNLAAALAAPPLRTYALATAIGVIPSSFIYAAVGAGLGKVFAEGRSASLSSLVRPEFGWALAGLAVLGVGAAVMAAWRARQADLPGAAD